MSDENNNVVRNEKGQITSRTLDSDKAREMAARRWEVEKGDTLTELLQLFEYDTPEDAPVHLRLLCEKSISTRSGNITALKDVFRMLKGNRGGGAAAYDPKKGGPCPTCGRSSGQGLNIPEHVLLALLAAARKGSEKARPLSARVQEAESRAGKVQPQNGH